MYNYRSIVKFKLSHKYLLSKVWAKNIVSKTIHTPLSHGFILLYSYIVLLSIIKIDIKNTRNNYIKYSEFLSYNIRYVYYNRLFLLYQYIYSYVFIIMSGKKIRTFSIFLLLGIATLFVPVTALQNSIANAQEYYNEEYEENEYYNQEYDP